MSKRSKNQSMYNPGQRRKAPIMPKDQAAVTKKGGKTATGAPKGGARYYERPTRTLEQMTAGIRVLGFAVALMSLAGALYWAASRNGSYPIPVIVGLVALGFLAGFALLIAVRAKEIAARAGR